MCIFLPLISVPFRWLPFRAVLVGQSLSTATVRQPPSVAASVPGSGAVAPARWTQFWRGCFLTIEVQKHAFCSGLYYRYWQIPVSTISRATLRNILQNGDHKPTKEPTILGCPKRNSALASTMVKLPKVPGCCFCRLGSSRLRSGDVFTATAWVESDKQLKAATVTMDGVGPGQRGHALCGRPRQGKEARLRHSCVGPGAGSFAAGRQEDAPPAPCGGRQRYLVRARPGSTKTQPQPRLSRIGPARPSAQTPAAIGRPQDPDSVRFRSRRCTPPLRRSRSRRRTLSQGGSTGPRLRGCVAFCDLKPAETRQGPRPDRQGEREPPTPCRSGMGHRPALRFSLQVFAASWAPALRDTGYDISITHCAAQIH